MRTIVILMTPGTGGPHAWAERLRRELDGVRPVLVACIGPGPDRPHADVRLAGMDDLVPWLQSLPPAIVLPNWIWEAYAALHQLKEGGHDIRIVAYCRSDDESSYYDPLRANAPYYDWLVAVSRKCYAECRRRLPGKADRTRLLWTFVERPDTLDRTWQNRPIRLLYSGRIENRQKRPLDLVEMAGVLLDRGVDFRLRFVGDGEDLPELEHRVSNLPHQGRVVVSGPVPHDSMGTVYAGSDVLLQPSASEGLSNSLLEAMSSGCVPVLTDVGSGVEDVMPEDLRRLLIQVGDASGMAALVTRLAGEPNEIEALGRLAHAATADFSWDRYQDRLTTLLAEVEAE